MLAYVQEARRDRLRKPKPRPKPIPKPEPRPITPKRPAGPKAVEQEPATRRAYVDERAPAFKAAIHEAGHCLEFLLYGNTSKLDYAQVQPSGEGVMVHSDHLLKTDRRKHGLVLAGGWAAVREWGFSGDGTSSDFQMMNEIGIPTANGSGLVELSESHALKNFRKQAQQDVKDYRRFVQALANELFQVHPENVSRLRILELWQQHR